MVDPTGLKDRLIAKRDTFQLNIESVNSVWQNETKRIIEGKRPFQQVVEKIKDYGFDYLNEVFERATGIATKPITTIFDIATTAGEADQLENLMNIKEYYEKMKDNGAVSIEFQYNWYLTNGGDTVRKLDILGAYNENNELIDNSGMSLNPHLNTYKALVNEEIPKLYDPSYNGENDNNYEIYQ